MRAIFTAATADAAWAAFEELEEKWGKNHPAIGQLWRAAWGRVDALPRVRDRDSPGAVRYERDRVVEFALRARGHRSRPLPQRAVSAEVSVPGHEGWTPKAPAGTMGHPVEARAERVRHHLREPHACGGVHLTRRRDERLADRATLAIGTGGRSGTSWRCLGDGIRRDDGSSCSAPEASTSRRGSSTARGSGSGSRCHPSRHCCIRSTRFFCAHGARVATRVARHGVGTRWTRPVSVSVTSFIAGRDTVPGSPRPARAAPR